MYSKYSVAVLVNPATKHVEYIPLDQVKFKIDGNQKTLEVFYNEYLDLAKEVETLKEQLTELESKQTQINDLLTNSVKLVNEKLSVVETDIDTLQNFEK